MNVFCGNCDERKPVYSNGKQVRCQQCGNFHGLTRQFAGPITTVRLDQKPNPRSRRRLAAEREAQMTPAIVKLVRGFRRKSREAYFPNFKVM